MQTGQQRRPTQPPPRNGRYVIGWRDQVWLVEWVGKAPPIVHMTKRGRTSSTGRPVCRLPPSTACRPCRHNVCRRISCLRAPVPTGPAARRRRLATEGSLLTRTMVSCDNDAAARSSSGALGLSTELPTDGEPNHEFRVESLQIAVQRDRTSMRIAAACKPSAECTYPCGQTPTGRSLSRRSKPDQVIFPE